jgi:hypothetical protein
MAPPLRCQQEFPDDPDIQDGDQMLRRVPPKQIIFDQNMGRLRPSSATFEDDEDDSPMSMYRRTVIDATGGNIERVMVGHAGYGLAGLCAGELRSRNQTVHSNPLEDEPAHAEVCGRKTDSNRKFFYQRSVWVIAPP